MTGDDLAAYCARIGYSGPLRADVATLHALHRAHISAFPFENLEVQLGAVPSLDPQAIFDKLVTRRRGGWCYEQNGLLGQALAAIGFPVTRLATGVVRANGLPQAGSHLALKVIAEGPWLVDGGFGSWIAAPIPLEPGAHDLRPWPLRLDRLPSGEWRLERGGATPMAYHFVDAPADEALLAEMCRWQAAEPASVFVQTLVAQRLDGEVDWSLRGRVLTRTDAQGSTTRLLADADDLLATLAQRFSLNLPQAASLWPAICARHDQLFGGLGGNH